MARLSNWQLGMLHSVPASLGIKEDNRRLIQLNVGGADSGALMGPGGFVAVMAFYETHGWIDPRHGAGHWGRLNDRANALGPAVLARRRKVYKLGYLLGWTVAGEPRLLDMTRLDGMAERVTQGRRRRMNDCDAADLGGLIEALKAMTEREEVHHRDTEAQSRNRSETAAFNRNASGVRA